MIAAAATLASGLLIPCAAFAQDVGGQLDGASGVVEPALGLPLASILALLLVPMLLVLGSAFVKVAVVLGLLRSAFGSSDVPPPLVITALAILISVIVMTPIARATLEAAGPDAALPEDIGEATALWDRAGGPLLDFLQENSSEHSRERFASVVLRGRESAETPDDGAQETRRLDVLLPSFVATELTEAFQMGLLLLLPFLVLDLVVAAVLQGAGLATVQPAVVSLPLKLALFVALDGWQLLLEALLLGYG